MDGGSQRKRSPAVVAVAVATAAVAIGFAGVAAATPARLGASLRTRDAAAILRAGRATVRLAGPSGKRLRVQLTLSGTGTRRRGRRALAAGVPASAPGRTRLDRHGRATLAVALNAAGRRRLRAALARCSAAAMRIHVLG